MADIFHSVRVAAPTDEVFRAVIGDDLFRAWWRSESEGDVVMRRIALEHGARVAWRCIAGPPEWAGTHVTFLIAKDGDTTLLRFVHENWHAATDLLAHCSTKWARVLFALKSRLETPEAEDITA